MRTSYRDFREYLEELTRRELLIRVETPIDKDSELSPLVRWQFRGLKSDQRKGWLFTNPTDARGRTFDASVAISVLGASPAVYAAAMGTTDFDKVSDIWEDAILHPMAPVEVPSADAPVKEVIVSEEQLSSEGVDMFPVPVMNPGTDASAYFSSPVWITKDPETGRYNAGTYRAMVKGPKQLGVLMLPGQDGRMHWQKARALGKRLEAVMVIGPIPAMTICSVSKLENEYEVAGAINQKPLELVAAETVDLLIPATAELAIEGYFRTDVLEHEGPFGEYTGFTGSRDYGLIFEVTAITHRKSPVFQAFISEMPPSESSLIRKPGWEAPLRKELRQRLPSSFKDVNLFEESGTNYFLAIQLKSPALGEAWHALHIANAFSSNCFKWIIVVDDDVDISDLGNVIWAMSFRVQPHRDIEIARGKVGMLDPSAAPLTATGSEHFYPGDNGCSVILIDATRKWAFPRISLPDEKRMLRAKEIWESLELPPLSVQGTWHAYDLGFWPAQWASDAELAAAGRYLETGQRLAKERTLASYIETGKVTPPPDEELPSTAVSNKPQKKP